MATLNPALRSFWETPARNRVLYGGRASSKSWDAAGVAIARAAFIKTRFLCTRQFQNKISESVYTLLKIQIDRFRLRDDFVITNNKITCVSTGSEFVFYGLWRHVDEIKSLEGIDVHWAEEAHLLSKAQWEIIEPTIRKEGSENWIIFNPGLMTDFVWRRFVINPPPDTVIRHINYDENPFLSTTMLKIIDAAKIESEDDFNHVYLGHPLSDDEQAIIKRSHIMAAIDAHKILGIDIRGSKTIGFDVADDGEDACAMVESYGSLATWSDTWRAKEDELLKSCARVWTEARERKAAITYDAIGVGASCGAKFNELNDENKTRIQHKKYFAGGAPSRPNSKYASTDIKNRDFFSNIKAQSWWMIADRLKNTYNAVKNGQQFDDDDMIFIDSNMPNLNKLLDELCTPKKDFDKAGRVMVEAKKELAKRGIASPNLADAFVMTFDTTGKSGLLF